MLNELNRTLANVWTPLVVESKGGYWRHRYDQLTVASQDRYRITPRAAMGGMQRMELADASGLFSPLTEATPAEVAPAQGMTNSTAVKPLMYDVEGDSIVLLPKPSTTGITLRMHVYLRPSRLVTQQSSTLGGGTIRGTVTAVNTVARTIVVDVVPFDQELATPAAITTAVQKIDVVHPDGWHEVVLAGATQTLAGAVFTVGGIQSMADIAVGDFVRAAEQTDWPCLPDEYHQTLADCVGVRLMLQQNMVSKAKALAEKLGLTEKGLEPGTDLERFRRAITPRNQTQPKRVVRRTGIISGSRQPHWWWWP